MSAVGQSVARVDGVAKVTGQAKYAVDFAKPGMLHGHVVRSTRAHAAIKSIRTDRAESIDGVVAVITAESLTGLFPRYGHVVADHPILAIDKVRFYGEPVALIVAESPYIASDAAGAVRIKYEDLPSVMTPEAALSEDAPLLHTQSYPSGDQSFSEAQYEADRSNIAHQVDIEWGDVDAAMAEASHIVETTARYPMLYAYAMEPYNALAEFDEGTLDVISTAQHPFQVREDLARIFSLPLNQVRVRSPLLGGGYGSKSYTKVEPLAAVGAWATGRPVQVALDVEGAIHTTRADSAVVKAKTGLAADGTILAREFDLVLDTGAYSDNGTLVLAKAVHRCFGPYRVPNLRATGKAVFTNTVPSSSYRGFGAPQGTFAGELNLDRAAAEMNLDPFEIRRKNLISPGERHFPKKRGMDADLVADLDIIQETLNPATGPNQGIGFGCSASDAGAFPVSTASVRIFADSSVTVLTGSTEMGQGSRTALAQIAAQELGLPIEQVRVVQSDTAVTPYERTTGASRTTTLTGLAIQYACRDALAKLENIGAELMDCSLDDVKTSDGIVAGPHREMTFEEAIQGWFLGRQGEVVGNGIVRRAGDLAELPPFWEIGMVGVSVSVDPDTGQVTVDHLVTVGDVGKAINPAMVEGQDLGAATQGLGGALSEELVYDGPQIVNPNLVDYRIPQIADLPGKIDLILAERADGIGPFGAKGAGEGSLNPIGSAIAAAVGRATGTWPEELPLTAERVWRLMNS